MEKIKISLDTNVVSKVLDIFKWKISKKDVLLELKKEYSSKIAKNIHDLYNLIISENEYEFFISPFVCKELELLKDKNTNEFINSKLKIIQLNSKYKYDDLVDVYLQKDAEGKSLLKEERSRIDAYIMAHSAYHGMPLITFNKKDFPVIVSKKINNINKDYFKNINEENKTMYVNKLPIKSFLVNQFFRENKIKVDSEHFQM